MSQDYHYRIVVGWDGKNPLDEHGHHLNPHDMHIVEPQKANKSHPNKGFWTPAKTPRQIAQYNICDRTKLGLRRKFFRARELTNPYGSLEFAVGNGDDFYCYDYATLEDGRIVLHATVNSETGSFIDGAGYEVVPVSEAADVALNMVDQGLMWCGDNRIRHTKAGWNQDPYYFYRSVMYRTDSNPNKPDFSCRELRFGSKRFYKYQAEDMKSVVA